MYSVITTAINYGLEAVPVHVEADISEGLPCFDMVGFLSAEVKEAKERVKTALKNCGFPIPAKHITVNLTPANMKKTGNSCDLPVAVSLLTAIGYISEPRIMDYIIMGEVSLNGTILPVNGTLSAAIMAKREGYAGIIVPSKNAEEAAILEGIQVVPVSDINELMEICENGIGKRYESQGQRDLWTTRYDVDFSEIHGQPLVRRACEIAISGMHNLLMIGPPGSGKTMAAKRLPTIMPELSMEEKLEISQIYSLSGLLDDKRIIQNERPFRSPHHTVTPQALAGGGRIPHPGEISLAHHGILFLDELPEFHRNSLEILREPMEEKQIHISRIEANIVYPADFLMICAMNPCSCGFYPDLNRCSCTSTSIRNYINRVSQALLDRIDMSVETREISFEDMTVSHGEEEDSETIRKRVEQAHMLQRERYKEIGLKYNSQLKGKQLYQYCRLSQEAAINMEQSYEEYHLSARTYEKLLKVSRTIADLDHSDLILWKHVQEALCFRGPNKKYWG